MVRQYMKKALAGVLASVMIASTCLSPVMAADVSGSDTGSSVETKAEENQTTQDSQANESTPEETKPAESEKKESTDDAAKEAAQTQQDAQPESEVATQADVIPDDVPVAVYYSESGDSYNTDGTLVFQMGDDGADSEEYGTHMKAYTGFDTEHYQVWGCPWNQDSDISYNITKVVFKDKIAPVSTAYWFYNFGSTTEMVGMENLDTSKVTDMSGMFSGCSSMEKLDLSHFNTSNVTNMSGMFQGMSSQTHSYMSLKELDVSNFDTSKVTDMSYMFYDEANLKSLDLSNFNTENVTNMESMFASSMNLEEIKFSGFDTSNVTNMSSMFSYCNALKKLDLSSFDTSKVTNMSYMFEECGNLKKLVLGAKTKLLTSCNLSTSIEWKITGTEDTLTADEVISRSGTEALSLERVPSPTAILYSPGNDISKNDGVLVFQIGDEPDPDKGTVIATYMGVDKAEYALWNNDYNFDTSSVAKVEFTCDIAPVSTQGWFSWMSNLKSIVGIKHLDTSNVTSMSSMFYYCSSLEEVDLSSFNTEKVTDMSEMFYGCKKLTKVTGLKAEHATNMSEMFRDCTALTSMEFGGTASGKAVMNMNSMFSGCTKLTSVTGLHTESATNMGSMFYGCSALTELDFSGIDTSNVTNMNSMFQGCTSLTAVPGLKTEKVTNMAYMFSSCSKLESVDFSETDTSKVTSMSYMFAYCGSLKTVTGLQMNGVTGSLQRMFYNCSSLTELDFSDTSTNKVTNLSEMFSGCKNLETVKGIKTDAATNLSKMFYECTALITLDLSGFNTAKVTDMSSMFYNCIALTTLDLPGFNTAKVTNMSYMFYNCSGLKALDVSGFNTAKVTNMTSMFYNCSNLKELDLSNFDTSKAYSNNYMFSMFSNCFRLETLKIGASTKLKSNVGLLAVNWKRTSDEEELNSTELITGTQSGSMEGTYTRMPSIMARVYSPSGNLSNNDGIMVFQQDDTSEAEWGTLMKVYTGFETIPVSDNSNTSWYTDYVYSRISKVIFKDKVTPQSAEYWFYNMSNLKSIEGWENFDTSQATSMKNMFYKCTSLTELDLTKLNTGNVTNMTYMFSGCTKLETVNLSGLDTKNVTNMSYMFNGCSALTSLNLSGMKQTSKVTTMYNMFSSCGKLAILDLSDLDTSSVTNMANMFAYDYKLTDLNVSKFNTENVTSMYYMFYNCNVLKDLDVSKFNTANVTNMSYMFYNCKGLEELNVSGFNTEKVTDMSNMFYTCSSIKKIDVSGFNTENVTNMRYMFAYCSKVEELDLRGFDTSKTSSSNQLYMLSNCSLLTRLKVGAKTKLTSNIYIGSSNDKWFRESTQETLTRTQFYTALSSLTAEDTFRKLDTTSIMAVLYSPSGNIEAKHDGELVFQVGEIPDTSKGKVVVSYKGMDTKESYATPQEVPWDAYRADIKTITFNAAVTPKSTAYWFYNMTALTSISSPGYSDGQGYVRISTLNVTDMSHMFENCIRLPELVLTTFETTAATNMTDMLKNCNGLLKLKIGSKTRLSDNVGLVDDDWLMKSGYSDTQTVNTAKILELSQTGGIQSSYMYGYPTFTRAITAILYSKSGNLDNGDGELVIQVGTNTDQTKGTVMKTYSGEGSWNGADYWNYNSYLGKIHTVTIKDYVSPSSVKYWFSNMSSLERIDGLEKLDTGKVTDMSYMFENCRSLKTLDLSSLDTSNVTNMEGMFVDCRAMERLNLKGFDTSKVTNMRQMFSSRWHAEWDWTPLKEVDLSTFDTSNVTDMSQMFAGCHELENLDLSTFDTSNVTNMENMLADIQIYGTLTTGPKTTLNADTCGLVNQRWWHCETEKTLLQNTRALYDIVNASDRTKSEDFKWARAMAFLYSPTGNIENNDGKLVLQYGMEADLTEGTLIGTYYDIDSTNFSISGSYYEKNAWRAYKENIREIYAKDPVEIPNMSNWFSKMTNLETADLHNLNMENTTNLSSLFYDDPALTRVNVVGWNTEKVTSMSRMFAQCRSLPILDLSSFTVNEDTNVEDMLLCCASIDTLILGSGFKMNADMDMPYGRWQQEGGDGTVLKMEDLYAVIPGLTSATTFTRNKDGLSVVLYSPSGNMEKNWDGQLVFQMGEYVDPSLGKVYMTYSFDEEHDYSSSGTYVDGYPYKSYPWHRYMRYLENVRFDTKVAPTSMACWFYYADSLKKVDTKNLDLSRNTSLHLTFESCYDLVEIDTSSWNTSQLTDMHSAFNSCSSLKVLDVSGWDTGNVTDMYRVFAGCKSLSEIDVSNFDTSKVTCMEGLFWRIPKAKTIDVSHFDTSNVTNMNWMFMEDEGLESLDFSNFDTSKVTEMRGMFIGCTGMKVLDLSSFDTGKVTKMDEMLDFELYTSSKTKIQKIILGPNTVLDDTVKLKDFDWKQKSTREMVKSDAIITTSTNGKGDTFARARDVTFVDRNGESVQKVTVDDLFGTDVIVEETGAKDCEFSGWYTGQNGTGTKLNAGDNVLEDTYYAYYTNYRLPETGSREFIYLLLLAMGVMGTGIVVRRQRKMK